MGEFNYPKAHVFLVRKGSGIIDLIHKINSGALIILGYEIVITLLGRADVLDRTCSIQERVQDLVAAIGKQDPATLLLMGTPLPWANDEERLVRKLFKTGHLLRSMCGAIQNLYFTKATEDFSTWGVINGALFKNSVTQVGKSVIYKLLKGKIVCAKLRNVYNKHSARMVRL